MIKYALRKLKNKFMKYFSRYGVITGLLNYLISYALQFRKISRRKKEMLSHPVYGPHKIILDKLNQNKFVIVNIDQFSGFEKVKSHLLNASKVTEGVSMADLKIKFSQVSQKAYWVDILPSDENIRNEIFNFFQSPEIIAVIGRYLGEKPHLESVSYFYSPFATNSTGEASQLWHKDRDQYNKLKIFYSPFGTSEQNGCTKIFNHNVGTFKTYPNYPWYFNDKEAVKNKWPLEKIVNLELSDEEFGMVDTGLLAHKGADKQVEDRFQLIVSYGASPSRLKISLWKNLQKNAVSQQTQGQI
jgi:hypothetical protein